MLRAVGNVNAPGSLGYVSGSYYGGRGTAGTSTVAANVLYLWPVRADATVTIDRLAFINNTAVVGNAKLGIYDSSAAGGRPGNLIREITADLSTNVGVALVAGSMATNPTLVPGWYWLGVCFSAAAVVYSATGTGTAANSYLYEQAGSPDGLGPGSGNPQVRRTAALTYVSGPTAFFPASCGATTTQDAVPASPILEWRAV